MTIENKYNVGDKVYFIFYKLVAYGHIKQIRIDESNELKYLIEYEDRDNEKIKRNIEEVYVLGLFSTIDGVLQDEINTIFNNNEKDRKREMTRLDGEKEQELIGELLKYLLKKEAIKFEENKQ